MSLPPSVTIISHPLVQHKLSLMRDKSAGTSKFRTLMREIGMLMAYEVLRDLELTYETIATPLTEMEAPFVAGKKLVLAPILRAGLGLMEGVLDLVPSARVAHVGLYRDPKTLNAVEYYFKIPEHLDERLVVVIDPMLKEANAGELRLVCLLAAPEGIENFTNAHPDVALYTAAIDSHLNDHSYIVPGLGDAGDRTFGTQ
ncbi:MAG: uracil phosphoribosyltransferase [Alphaproteobacteria bacterium]